MKMSMHQSSKGLYFIHLNLQTKVILQITTLINGLNLVFRLICYPLLYNMKCQE